MIRASDPAASRATPNHDDNSVMGLRGCKAEKVVPIASQQHATMLMAKLEDGSTMGFPLRTAAERTM